MGIFGVYLVGIFGGYFLRIFGGYLMGFFVGIWWVYLMTLVKVISKNKSYIKFQ